MRRTREPDAGRALRVQGPAIVYDSEMLAYEATPADHAWHDEHGRAHHGINLGTGAIHQCGAFRKPVLANGWNGIGQPNGGWGHNAHEAMMPWIVGGRIECGR